MKFTETQIKQSIETGILDLDQSEEISYFVSGVARIFWYVWVPFLILMSFANLSVNNSEGQLILLCAVVTPVLLFIILTLLKQRNLKLIRAETSLTEKEARELIVEFSSIYKWKVCNNRKSLMILKTGPGRTGAEGWGERITVLHDGNRVWVNSIYDPSRKMSWTSFSRNTDNVRHLRQVLSGHCVPEEKSRTGRKG